MKLILLSVLLVSCFKTVEDIQREKTVNSLSTKLTSSGKIVASLTNEIQELRNKQMQLQGSIEELSHSNRTQKEERDERFEQALNQISEQLKAVMKSNAQNEEQLQKLQEEVSGLKSFTGKVSNTLKDLSRSPKSTTTKSVAPVDLLGQAHRAFEKNQQSRATELYRQALDSGKISAGSKNHIYYNLGLMDYWNKRYDKALVNFSKIYSKYPQSSWAKKALLFLARSFRKTNREKEANATYKRLIKEFPRTSEARKAQEEMKK